MKMIFWKIYYFSVLIIKRFLQPTAAVDFCPCADRTCNNIWDNFPSTLPLWIFYFDKEKIYNHGIEGTLELELDTGGQLINVPSRKSPVLYCKGDGPCVKTSYDFNGRAASTSEGHDPALFAVWVKMNDRLDELERMKTSPMKKTDLIYFPNNGNKISYDQETGEWYVAFKGRYVNGNLTYPMNNSHRWNHIAVSTVHENNEHQIRLYINGNKVKTVACEKSNSNEGIQNPTFLGPTPDHQTVYSRFFVDTMRLWYREFTDEEVMEIYQDELEFED